MSRSLLGAGYRVIHRFLHRTLPCNPFIPKTIHGKGVQYGFISNEHLAHPELDQQILDDLSDLGIEVGSYQIDLNRYRDYLRQADYPTNYHGGGRLEGKTFEEKSLEHFVSAELLKFTSEDVFIDIASDRSPFHEIVRKLWNPKEVYSQDLSYPTGIHGNRVGGDAGSLPFPDNSISKATLHCSLEHFEGDSDQSLFRELGRVLKPGGVLCVLPFYLAGEYTIHTDPIHCWFFAPEVSFDPEAQLRYCNWTNRHSRHYDIAALGKRILPNLNGLNLKVLSVTNFREVHPSCYLRFVGLFEKPMPEGFNQ
jgi:SAM-dependent methyltransferase